MNKESLITLFVHTALLNILAQKAIRDNPRFAEEAIGELDAYLGKLAHGGYHPLPDAWLAEARDEFVRIILGPLQLTFGMPETVGVEPHSLPRPLPDRLRYEGVF